MEQVYVVCDVNFRSRIIKEEVRDVSVGLYGGGDYSDDWWGWRLCLLVFLLLAGLRKFRSRW